MTTAEIALAITLVAGAGWLIRGFANLQAIDPGFAPDQRLAFDVALQGPKYPNGQALAAGYDELFSRLRALPGVAAVGATTNLPLKTTPENSVLIQRKGEVLDPQHPLQGRQRGVSPGFFDALGIRLVSGRDFTSDDRQGNQLVAVVNRTFVRVNLPDRDPIGQIFSFGYPAINPNEYTVVGVVDDVRQRELVTPGEPAFYTPNTQFGLGRRQTVIVHTRSANAASVEGAIRDEVHKFDPQVAVDFELVSDVVSSTLQRQQLGMMLMLLFGAAAAALAAVGIYGVVAYAAAERRSEMATRLALGATPGTVFRLVLRQGGTLALIGTVIGLAAAYASGRVIANRLYGVKAWDPGILSGAIALVVAVTLLATMVPAFRASRLDPARVLRPE
jgi:predicted permease